MEDPREKLKKTLRRGRLYVAAGNLLGAICFLVAYSQFHKLLILICALILVVAAILVYFFFGKIEKIVLRAEQKQNSDE